jgi:hypothetical protein
VGIQEGSYVTSAASRKGFVACEAPDEASN